MQLKDRVIGCLLGGGLGDAWGGPTEGRPGSIQFKIPEKPALSDDTQLTLATCESIVEYGQISPENIASHFLRWYRARRIRGVGSSTLKAMRDLANGTHWALAGARGEFTAGNGAAMRIAPLAFLLDPNNAVDRGLIRDICRITHHNDEAYAGALAVVVAIRSALMGGWSQHRRFLACAVECIPDSAVRDRIQALLTVPHPSPEVASTFGVTGHVVDTVPLALCCAQAISVDLLPVVLARTISLGGDTDTIASITGQIAGTVVGPAGVPNEFIAAVEGSDELSGIAERFAEFVVEKATT